MKKRVNQGGAEHDTGPILLKYCVDTYRGPSRIKVLSTEYLYPINWSINQGGPERLEIVKDGKIPSNKKVKKMFPNSYAVTYWTHTW